MHLIHTTLLELHEFFGEAAPRYAILSHRWEDDEVTFQDMGNGTARNRAGWKKVSSCCQKARDDGWMYLWIDSCCIDKTSSAELSEAINTMFEWYERSQICYAYLSDVPPAINLSKSDRRTFFIQSQWFTRGWTLQELLAPRWVEFLDSNWSEIGTKSSLAKLISVATNIKHLFNFRSASIAQKMSWASTRQTTRVEDRAYCLMGLFGVNMPLLYGEGMNAFLRLQLAILSQNDDETIFAWERVGSDAGLLASSPNCFHNAGNIEIRTFDSLRPPFSMTNKGLCLELYLFPSETSTQRLVQNGGTVSKEKMAPLNCVTSTEPGKKLMTVALVLFKISGNWVRRDRLVAFDHTSSPYSTKGEREVVYIEQPRFRLTMTDIPLEMGFTINTRDVCEMGFILGRREVKGDYCNYRLGEGQPLGALPQNPRQFYLSVRFPEFVFAAFCFEKVNYSPEIISRPCSFTLLIGASPHRAWIDVITHDYRDPGILTGLNKWPLNDDDPAAHKDRIVKDLGLGPAVQARLRRVQTSEYPAYGYPACTIDLNMIDGHESFESLPHISSLYSRTSTVSTEYKKI